MIDHIWTVLCTRAVIDKDSNNVSLHNVIEQLTIQEEVEPRTMVACPMEAVTLWERADPEVSGKARARVRVSAPSGVSLGDVEYVIDLIDYQRFRGRVGFPGILVVEPGRYTVRVDLLEEGDDDWREVAAVPLTVIAKMAEDDAATSGDS